MNVLIADDSTLIITRLVKVLSPIKGINRLYIAKDGRDTLDLFYETKTDAMILDISLPELNGIDILKKVKRESPEVKVIIYTSYPTSDFKDACEKLGADYFLDKAMDLEKVESILHDIIIDRGTMLH